MQEARRAIVVGVVGHAGSGKTTLIERLVAHLTVAGKTVSVIKRAHPAFAVDHPGKDSYRHRQAGAHEVLVAGGGRWVLMHEPRGHDEPSLDAHLERLSPCNFVFVEGFKRSAIPKIEVHRAVLGKPLPYPECEGVVALATDVAVATTLPQFALDDIEGVARFVSDCAAWSVHVGDTESSRARECGIGDVGLGHALQEQAMKISARNQIKGTVKSVSTGAVNADVVIEIAPGIEITAQITEQSVKRLGLKPGAAAYAIIKADSVMVGVD